MRIEMYVDYVANGFVVVGCLLLLCYYGLRFWHGLCCADTHVHDNSGSSVSRMETCCVRMMFLIWDFLSFSLSFSLSLQSLLRKSNYVNVMLNLAIRIRFTFCPQRPSSFNVLDLLLFIGFCLSSSTGHRRNHCTSNQTICKYCKCVPFFCSCHSINPKSTERMQKKPGNYQRHKRWFNGILLSNRQLKGITMS